MDEEAEDVVGGGVTREDVVDAIEDEENGEALNLLTEYYEQMSGKGVATGKRVINAKKCAQLLYDAKRYEDVHVWLDLVATNISDKEGPDSEAYMAFTEDEDLETLRMKATDKSLGDEEEEEYEDDDE